MFKSGRSVWISWRILPLVLDGYRLARLKTPPPHEIPDIHFLDVISVQFHSSFLRTITGIRCDREKSEWSIVGGGGASRTTPWFVDKMDFAP